MRLWSLCRGKAVMEVIRITAGSIISPKPVEIIQASRSFGRNLLVGPAVTRLSLEREVRRLNLWPVESDILLPTARHRCDIPSKGALLLGRNDSEMGSDNWLRALAYYSEYNKRNSIS